MSTDLVFDSSSIISISLNSLIPTLVELKKLSSINFIIPKSVKKEVVDNPMNSKKYKLEAIMLSSLIGSLFKTSPNINVQKKALQLQELVNSIFIAHGKPLKIVDIGEMEGLATAIFLKAPYVVDERTTRLLVENPKNLHQILSRKFHTNVTLNKEKLHEFLKQTKEVQVLRSVEIMTIAFEKGLFKNYQNKHIPGNFKRQVLEAILWGLKLKGCSISTEEIHEILGLEKV